MHWLARADISLRHTFIDHWNGISLVPPAAPAHFITSDASGSWGCGALHYITSGAIDVLARKCAAGATTWQ